MSVTPVCTYASAFSGIIGAVGNNSIGMSGVNWQVQLLACKFLLDNGEGLTSDAISCMQYCRVMGASVINHSYGGEDDGHLDAEYEEFVAGLATGERWQRDRSEANVCMCSATRLTRHLVAFGVQQQLIMMDAYIRS